jgi:hypothetical protein
MESAHINLPVCLLLCLNAIVGRLFRRIETRSTSAFARRLTKSFSCVNNPAEKAFEHESDTAGFAGFQSREASLQAEA